MVFRRVVRSKRAWWCEMGEGEACSRMMVTRRDVVNARLVIAPRETSLGARDTTYLHAVQCSSNRLYTYFYLIFFCARQL
jgi:hypothetical protein